MFSDNPYIPAVSKLTSDNMASLVNTDNFSGGEMNNNNLLYLVILLIVLYVCVYCSLSSSLLSGGLWEYVNQTPAS